LWRSGEADFHLQLPAPLREPIQKQLAKYILRAKVQAADASGDWTLAGIAGGGAGDAVRRATGLHPESPHDVAIGPHAMVIRLPGERYEVAAARDKAAAILDALKQGAELKDAEYGDWLDIANGVPVVLPGTQEALVPQMANLDIIGGVSFDKGCYPGQEIVARMRYRGTLKQRMYRARVDTAERPAPGTKLYSPAFGEQSCGTVLNAARSPDGGHELLAAIQIAAVEQGDVRFGAPDGPAVTLLPLPYSVS